MPFVTIPSRAGAGEATEYTIETPSWLKSSTRDRIVSLRCADDHVLVLYLANGEIAEVNLMPLISTDKRLGGLLNQSVFRTAALTESGRAVTWNCERVTLRLEQLYDYSRITGIWGA